MQTPAKFLLAAAFTAAVSLPSGLAWADEVVTPTDLKGGKVITVDEGKKLLDGKAAVFIDTRSVVNFGKGHVPGALAAAYKEKSAKEVAFDKKLDTFDLDKLPKDKTTTVVFYSDGPTGWKSYKAAVWAVGAGYANVRYLRGGFSDWSGKGLPVER